VHGCPRTAITPDDHGFDRVVGKMVSSSIYEIAIERDDPSLGKMVNHFLKVGSVSAQLKRRV
jgi:hypothetical protein